MMTTKEMKSILLASLFSCLPLLEIIAQVSGSFESVNGIAVYAKSTTNYGVWGESYDSIGVQGYSYAGNGVLGTSWIRSGVQGRSALSSGGYFICLAKTETDLVIGANANSDDCIIASDPAYAGSDLFLRVNDAVVIELDKDQNENGQFEIRNGAGTILFSINETGTPLTTSTGAYLSTGGMWTNNSSATLKVLEHKLDGEELLNNLSGLPLYSWKYKAEPDVNHLGPTAEDFYTLFNCGDSKQHLAPSDMAAVALAGIQALQQENQKLKSTLQAVLEKITELELIIKNLSNNQ